MKQKTYIYIYDAQGKWMLNKSKMEFVCILWKTIKSVICVASFFFG